MVHIVNPPELHDPTPFGYGHTAVIPAGSELVVVAGQYASGPDGAVVAPDFPAQVEQVVANLEAALGAHGLALGDVVQLRTYVVDLDGPKLGVLGQALGSRLGASLPPQTAIGVAALAMPDILVEMEALAVRT